MTFLELVITLILTICPCFRLQLLLSLTWSYIFYAAMFWLAWTLPRDHCQVFNSLFNQQDYEKKTDDVEDILNVNKENNEKGLNGESLQNLL